MERIARKMGIERLSKGQVSAMCRSLDAGVAELASRGLGEAWFPYLFLDATYVKCRMDGRVQSTAVVTAIGVGSDGVRRMLGVVAIDTETHAGWLGFLRGLRERGLSGARLVVSDTHAGLVRAIAECLPGAGWQRCVVHLERDVCSLLASRRHRAMAGKVLQAVFRETDPATVRSAYRAAIDAVGAMSARAGALIEEAEADVLTYLDHPRPALYRSRRGLFKLDFLVGDLMDFVNNIQTQPVDNPSGSKRAVAGKFVKPISSLHFLESDNHANAERCSCGSVGPAFPAQQHSPVWFIIGLPGCKPRLRFIADVFDIVPFSKQ